MATRNKLAPKKLLFYNRFGHATTPAGARQEFFDWEGKLLFGFIISFGLIFVISNIP